MSHTMWTEENNTLTKTFACVDFKHAVAFVVAIGDIAEAQAHHPDVCIKNYNTVIVTTTTHDQGFTVTEKDRKLAEAIDTIVV